MSFPGTRHRYSYRDYLRLEAMANVRHEYFDGEIYAMAGGTPEHTALASNVIATLNAQLRGRGCQVYTSELRVRVLATGLATYPDVTVICGPLARDPEDRNTVTNPTVIVEVSSPTTAEYDRGDKLESYKRVPSLRAVVLVAYDVPRFEVWRRGREDEWERDEVTAGEAALTAIGCSLALDDVYREGLLTPGA